MGINDDENEEDLASYVKLERKAPFSVLLTKQA